MIKDNDKTKKQLVTELEELRLKITELEKLETERKNVEEKIKEGDEKYRLVIENSNQGIVIEHDNIIKFCNPKLLEITGYSFKELASKQFLDFIHIDDRRRAAEYHLKRYKGEDIPESIQFKFIDKYGKIKWVESYAVVFEWGGQPATLGFVSDITERKKTENSLKERKKELEGLYTLGQLFNETKDIEVIFSKLVNEIIPPSMKFPDKTLVIIEINRKTYCNSGKNKKYGIKNFLSSIINVKGKKRGILKVGYVENLYFIEKFEQDLIDGYAKRLGLFIENLEAEKSLKESEEKHRSLFETMTQGVVYQGNTGEIFSANRAAEQVLGLTLDKMQGRTSIDPRWKAVHKDGSDFSGETHPSMVALKTGKEVRNVIMGVFQPQREEYTWININAVPQFRPGEKKPFQVYTTFEDISERKLVGEALLESEERLSSFINSAEDSFYLLNSNLDFVEINKRGLEIIGKKREEVIGKNITDIVPDIKESGRYERHLEVIRTGVPFVIDDFIPHPVFGNLHFMLKSFKVGDGLGIIASDITERKLTEEKLRESEEKFSKAFQSSPNMMAITRMKDGQIIDVNQSFIDFTGYNRKELIGHTTLELNLWANQGERDKFVKTIQEKKTIQNFDVHLRHKSGKLITVLFSGENIIHNGEQHLITVATDITDRKELEKQIVKYSQKLEKRVKKRTKELELEKEKYKTLFDDSKDPIFLIDQKTSNVIDCNNKAKKLNDCHKQECCNKKFYNIYLNDDKNIIMKSLKKSVENQGINFISQTSFEKDTKSYFLETNLTPITFGKDKIIQAICRDISQTQKIENEIMKKILRYDLVKGNTYLIDEPSLDETFDVINNILECGFNGYIFSRKKPDFINRNIVDDVNVFWLAEKKIDKNTIPPIIKEIESKIENFSRGNNVILLDSLDYLLSKNEFKDILEFLQRLNEFIYIQKWILLIPIDSRIINKNKLNLLKKEIIEIKPKQKLELEKNIHKILKYINTENKLGRKPSINEIANSFKISRVTAGKRVKILENQELIIINKIGRLRLSEITDEGKMSL